MLEGDVQGSVTQVNELTKQIADLNKQIVKSQALGDNPNDLLDRRDLLVGKLSTLIDITIRTNDPAGEFVVTTGGMHIVQGQHHETIALKADKANEGYSAPGLGRHPPGGDLPRRQDRRPSWRCATGTRGRRSRASTSWRSTSPTS